MSDLRDPLPRAHVIAAPVVMRDLSSGWTLSDPCSQVAADRREREAGRTPCKHGHHFYCGHCGPEPFVKLEGV